MKLWHRNLSVGSPINSFLRNVRWDAQGSGDGGQGGASGGDSGQGQGSGGQGAGRGAQDWRAGLDPAIKDHAVLQKYSSKEDAIKALVDAQPLIGMEKIPIPQNFDKPEIREKFFNDVFGRLGLPKDAKDYKITDVKLPEGINLKATPEALDALKTAAHKLGILPYQLDGLYSWYMNDAVNKLKAHKEQTQKNIDDATAELRGEWGSAFDAKKALAEKVLDTFATQEEKAALIQTGFNNNPKVIRMLARLGEKISEDTFIKGGSESTMTPKEASAELAKVRAQLINMDRSNPEYKILEQRRKDLMEMATPSN